MPINPMHHYALENHPTVYDEDSLTALELCARTANKTNECVTAFNKHEETVKGHLSKQDKKILELFQKGMEEHVNNWLDAHPEATTTVQPGALTSKHFHDSLKYDAINHTKSILAYSQDIKGDGVTDDTDLIQGALSLAGECIYFPAGRYKVTKTLQVRGSVRFHPDAVIEFYPSSGNLVAFHLQGQRTNLCNDITCHTNGRSVTIEGMVMEGYVQAGDILFLQGDMKAHERARDYDLTRDVLKVESVNGSILTFVNEPEYNYDRVTVDKLTPVENAILDGINIKCMSYVAGSDGIRVDYGHHVEVRNCSVENFDNGQICVQYCLDTSINNNYCAVDYADQLQYGVCVHGGRKVTVHGNTINSERTAIDCTRLVTDVTISGNSVVGNINTHSSSNITITGNNILDGMLLIRGKGCIVNANTVQSFDASCIDIQEMGIAGGHVITNNIFRGYVYMKMYTTGITLANNHFLVTKTGTYTGYNGETFESVIRFMDSGNGSDQTRGASIMGNRFEHDTTKGDDAPLYCIESLFNLQTVWNVHIEGNIIKGFQSGINLAQTSSTQGENLSIKNNIIHCTQDGIMFRGAHNTQITGNTVIGTSKGRYGICRYFLDGAETTGLILSGNYVKNFQYGVYWWGSADTKKVVFMDNITEACDNTSQGISGNTTRVSNEIFIASPDKSVFQIKVANDGTISAVKQSYTM